MKIRVFSGAVVLGLAVSALVVGVIGGTAIAQTPQLFAPAGVSAKGAVPAPSPSYASNSSRLTYGSAGKAVSPETEPDLILVVASNGHEGYAYKTDLDHAAGADIQFKSPADALKWQETQPDKISVPVYASDGKTQLGEFFITRGDPPN